MKKSKILFALAMSVLMVIAILMFVSAVMFLGYWIHLALPMMPAWVSYCVAMVSLIAIEVAVFAILIKED